MWLGWTGISIAIAMFTPVGFFAACVAGVWIITASLLLYIRAEPSTDDTESDRVIAATTTGNADLTPTFSS